MKCFKFAAALVILLAPTQSWPDPYGATTSTVLRAIGLNQKYIDCSMYQKELTQLLSNITISADRTAREKLLKDLTEHPSAIDADLLSKELSSILEVLEQDRDNKNQTTLRESALKLLTLCGLTQTRAMDTTESQIEYIPPKEPTALPPVTRGVADQWVVKKTALGNTVTFDPASGNIKVNQDVQSGASVTFNGVTSTGAALALDAAAANPVNIGTTNASAVNIATGTAAATAVSMGTSANVTDINIGASATTSTIDITGVATVVTGSTSARVDGVTLNLGNTLATDINVGSGTATTVDVTGVTTNVTGSTAAGIDGTTVNLGNTTATTINMGTTLSTDINIGRAATTTLDILGTTLNVTGTTTSVSGSTSASIDGATVNLGNTTATTVNLGTTASTDINIGRAGTTTVDILGTTTSVDGTTVNLGNTSATTVNLGTTASTDINIGRAATTTLDILGTTLNVTGTTTAVTGSTSARLDGLTVNIGNTTATDVNIGNGSSTVDVTGSTISHTGTTSLLAGNELRFYNPAGTFYSSIKAGVITGASPATLVLPLTNGSSGQVLSTDGSGNLSWSSTGTNLSRVDAYIATTSQTTTATTETIIFNQADINPGGGPDYNTTTGVYTVPATGYYWINAQVCVQAVDVGTKTIDLVVNTVAKTGYQSYVVLPTITNSGSGPIYETHMINFGCLVHLTAADAVRIDYTGTTGDILLKNATHLSAYLMSA